MRIIYLNNLNAGLERTLSKFACDAKLRGAVDSLQGKEALQRPGQTKGLGNHQPPEL